MSIARLKKATIVGHMHDRDRVLADLQDLGCLHIIPLSGHGETKSVGGPTSEAREALRFLVTSPQQRRQSHQLGDFDAAAVERQALTLRSRLNDLRDERDFLVYRIKDLNQWGEFELPHLDAMGGHRLWFYVVPHRHMPAVESSGLRFEVVNRDSRFSYVVVVGISEPGSDEMPVPRTHTGDRPLSALCARQEEVEVAIEDSEAERAALTRWCELFSESLDRLEDDAARRDAAHLTLESQPLFALRAWVPEARMDALLAHATEHGLAIDSCDPESTEQPPTLLDNRPGLDAGEALVTFYMTPSYWSWDPSSIVLVSFAIFFGMIVADAGYAILLALGLWWYWQRLGRTPGGRRFRTLCASLTTATFLYGAMVGSYFGVAPAEESVLSIAHILDLEDSTTMMTLAAVVGVVHVVLANLMRARRLGRCAEALLPVGWALVVAGGFVLTVGVIADSGEASIAGTIAASAGVLLVFLFAGVGEKPIRRIVQGLLALTNLTKVFGDVLSYLRLFALGLATASLAVAFNDMAGDIRRAVPGIGLFFALLVLLLGHGLNLVLGLASGVIHGLRLNVIEFFNWGLSDEGRVYRPFRRKGD